MAVYEYRCEKHGVFEVVRRLGTATETATCSQCGEPAVRVVSLPMVMRASRSNLHAAMDRAEKSRHEPEVVTSLPTTGARKQTPVVQMTPALARLPRP